MFRPKTIKEIIGEGMPEFQLNEFKVENFGNPVKKGNMYIKFDIQFPKNLSEEQKNLIREMLKE